MKTHNVKPTVPIKFIATNRGLMKCTVADFDPQKYKGLHPSTGGRAANRKAKQNKNRISLRNPHQPTTLRKTCAL